MTGQRMCETIAWAIKDKTGESVEPRAIWEVSPRGELWPVVEAFENACAYIDARFTRRRIA